MTSKVNEGFREAYQAAFRGFVEEGVILNEKKVYLQGQSDLVKGLSALGRVVVAAPDPSRIQNVCFQNLTKLNQLYNIPEEEAKSLRNTTIDKFLQDRDAVGVLKGKAIREVQTETLVGAATVAIVGAMVIKGVMIRREEG